MDTKFMELEKKVQHLNNITWVIGTVAVIFGLGGAWGWAIIKEAKSQIVALTSDLHVLQTKLDSSTKYFADLRIINEQKFDDHVKQSEDTFFMTSKRELLLKFVPMEQYKKIAGEFVSASNFDRSMEKIN